MIAVLALEMFVNWVSVTEMFCDVKSDSVRAISVTLRLTAIPDANSSVPKNRISITGTTMANSMAATPLQSPNRSCTERRPRSHISIIGFITDFIGPALVRFVLERGGRGQQPLAAAQIRDVEAEPGDEQRPLIEDPHHDNVAGTAGQIVVRRHEILAGIDWVGDVDGAERGIALHVDRDTVRAIEHHDDLAANEVLELRLGEGRGLRLTGHDRARGILRRGLEHLAGEEHHRQLDDREQETEENRRDQRELDRGRATVVASKPAQDISGGGGGRGHQSNLKTREKLQQRIT